MMRVAMRGQIGRGETFAVAQLPGRARPRATASLLACSAARDSLQEAEASSCSMQLAEARAFVLAFRPVGNTAQRSIAGNCQSWSTRLTRPEATSGANI